MYQYDHKKRNIIVSVLTVVGSLCVLVPLWVAISFDWPPLLTDMAAWFENAKQYAIAQFWGLVFGVPCLYIAYRIYNWLPIIP